MVSIVNHQRRNFLTGRGSSTPPPFRLPWVIDERSFTQQCTRCHDCINVCEEKIIVVGSGTYPEINFALGECTFCQKCVEVCQQNFFKSDKTQRAWESQLSIGDNCLAKNEIFCQSCRDVCEYKAIKFTYSQRAIPEPQINQDLCSGCGACVSSCPNLSIQLSLLSGVNDGRN
jgi:ferredoxin-type protein NapF